jgi:hypothetical protein
MLWTSVRTLSFEKISMDGLLPIPKNARELQTHQGIDQFTQRPAWQCVLYLILNDRRSMLLSEAMGMHPVLIGAVPLDIDKLLRRVPALNLALPGEGDPEEMETVLDARPLTEVDGLRRHHLKAEFWRRNALQIGGLSKERKDRITWEWKTHGGGERV